MRNLNKEYIENKITQSLLLKKNEIKNEIQKKKKKILKMEKINYPNFNVLKSTHTTISIFKSKNRIIIPNRTKTEKIKIPKLQKKIKNQKYKRFTSPKKYLKKHKLEKDLNFNYEKNENRLIRENIILTEREEIKQNIFIKKNNYYYTGKINLSIILQKIFFENYILEDITDYLSICFKKLKNYQFSFFEVIFKETEIFANQILDYLVLKISRVFFFPEEFIKDKNGKIKKKIDLVFKPFSQNNRNYIKTINVFFSIYKKLNQIYREINKLINFYLKRNCKKKFCQKRVQFYHKIFVSIIYNNRIVHKFIFSIYNFFKKNFFYQNQYREASLKVFEIYENLEKITEETRQTKIKKKEDILENELKIKNREILLEKEKMELREKRRKLKLRKRKERKKKNRKKKLIEKKNVENILKDFELINEFEDIINKIDRVYILSDNFQRIVINFTKEERILYNF